MDLTIVEIGMRFYVLSNGDLWVPIAFTTKQRAQDFIFQQLIINSKGDHNE